jgi:hypothetical protein
MKHTILCKRCGDIVKQDSHFDECSDNCILYESQHEAFAGQAIKDYLRQQYE